MNTHADKTQENKSKAVANSFSEQQSSSESTFQFVDNRVQAIAQRKLQEIANNSPQMQRIAQLQAMADRQVQSKVNINDDAGLEREAQVAPAEQERTQGSFSPMRGMDAVQMEIKSETQEPLQPMSSTLPNMPIIQMVRKKIEAVDKEGISLETLEEAIVPIDREIVLLNGEDSDEVEGGFIDMERITEWREQYNRNIEELRALEPGDTEYSWTQIRGRTTETLQKMYKVIINLGNLRGTLNQSLKAYNKWKEEERIKRESEELLKQQIESYKKKEQPPKKKEVRKTPTLQGPIGLGSKWGGYNEHLRYAGQTQFVQFVPVDAKTIIKCLETQKLTDAAYNPRKAFWVSDETQYTISSSTGKVKMVYTFTKKGAQSLMEDYLICGSGDYAEDNEEEWSGETAHPDYTIWKTNELGAYGIGKNRLAQLESYCVSITVEK